MSDPNETTPVEIPVQGPQPRLTSLAPPSLVTDTGEHPVVVLRPESRSRFAAGLVVDATAIVCVTVLILFDKIGAEAGLPWIALLLGVKTYQYRRGLGAGAGAVLTILGMSKGV